MDTTAYSGAGAPPISYLDVELDSDPGRGALLPDLPPRPEVLVCECGRVFAPADRWCALCFAPVPLLDPEDVYPFDATRGALAPGETVEELSQMVIRPLREDRIGPIVLAAPFLLLAFALLAYLAGNASSLLHYP